MKRSPTEPDGRKRISAGIAVVAGLLLVQGCVTSRPPVGDPVPDDTRAYLEVLRSDFNAAKVRTLNQVMQLTPAEADVFWPIYRAYEGELGAVGDRKLVLIREFMGRHREGTLNEGNSRDLANRWLANVQDRLDLWKKYHQRIGAALSPIRAAQFLQVENQLAILADLGIASEMPIIR